MLSLALYTANPDSEFCIDQLVQESSQFNLAIKGTPDSPAVDLFPSLKRLNPDVVLLDLTAWDSPTRENVRRRGRLRAASFRHPTCARWSSALLASWDACNRRNSE